MIQVDKSIEKNVRIIMVTEPLKMTLLLHLLSLYCIQYNTDFQWVYVLRTTIFENILLGLLTAMFVLGRMKESNIPCTTLCSYGEFFFTCGAVHQYCVFYFTQVTVVDCVCNGWFRYVFNRYQPTNMYTSPNHISGYAFCMYCTFVCRTRVGCC